MEPPEYGATDHPRRGLICEGCLSGVLTCFTSDRHLGDAARANGDTACNHHQTGWKKARRYASVPGIKWGRGVPRAHARVLSHVWPAHKRTTHLGTMQRTHWDVSFEIEDLGRQDPGTGLRRRRVAAAAGGDELGLSLSVQPHVDRAGFCSRAMCVWCGEMNRSGRRWWREDSETPGEMGNRAWRRSRGRCP